MTLKNTKRDTVLKNTLKNIRSMRDNNTYPGYNVDVVFSQLNILLRIHRDEITDEQWECVEDFIIDAGYLASPHQYAGLLGLIDSRYRISWTR